MNTAQKDVLRTRIDLAATADQFAEIDRELQGRVDSRSADVQELIKHLEGRSAYLIMRAMFAAGPELGGQLQRELAQRSGSGYTFSFSNAMDVPELRALIRNVEEDDRIEALLPGSPIFMNHRRSISEAAGAESLGVAWQNVLNDTTLSYVERGRLATAFEAQHARLAADQMTAITAEVGDEALQEYAEGMGSVLAEDEGIEDLTDDLDAEQDEQPAIGVAVGLRDRILQQVINAEALAAMEDELPGISEAFAKAAERVASGAVVARQQLR